MQKTIIIMQIMLILAGVKAPSPETNSFEEIVNQQNNQDKEEKSMCRH